MGPDVVVITNSPGELSSWVRVTVEKVRQRSPDVRIIVMLVPCPYASGREAEIAESWPDVDLVLSPREFISHLVGVGESRYRPAENGVVVFLGGDYWHAVLMARKLGFPAVAYTDRPSQWGRYFRQICVADTRTRAALIEAGVPESKVSLVGNLMFERVRPSMTRAEALRAWGMREDALTVGLFPGSRYYHVQASLAVFLRVAEDMAREVPNVQFAIGLSPFLDFDELRRCLVAQRAPYLTGSNGKLVLEEGVLPHVETEGGLRIPVVQRQQYDLMNASEMVLTIPGTNTAEIACLGRPMVVAMSWRAKVPRGGLGALISALPMASMVRRNMLKGILRKIKFTALPNMIAQREIVPEVRVEHEPAEISRVAADLLRNERRRNEMSAELRATLGGQGAADRMADVVLDACRPACVEVSA